MKTAHKQTTLSAVKTQTVPQVSEQALIDHETTYHTCKCKDRKYRQGGSYYCLFHLGQKVCAHIYRVRVAFHARQEAACQARGTSPRDQMAQYLKGIAEKGQSVLPYTFPTYTPKVGAKGYDQEWFWSAADFKLEIGPFPTREAAESDLAALLETLKRSQQAQVMAPVAQALDSVVLQQTAIDHVLRHQKRSLIASLVQDLKPQLAGAPASSRRIA